MSEQDSKVPEGWKLNPEWDHAQYKLVHENGCIFGFLREHKTIPILHIRKIGERKNMNDAELRELDVWIAEHVFQCTDIKSVAEENAVYSHKLPMGRFPSGYSTIPRYSAFRQNAMEVLERCAEKCTVLITKTKSGECCASGVGVGVNAATLPLAICLFAKQLFNK